MARADLHYAMVLDSEIAEASRVDPSLLDPVVRVDGALPGVARPVTVVREYQGPQGAYLERFELRDRTGRVVHRSLLRRVELRGEMFEDRFENQIRGLELADAEELTAVFSMDDEEVGAVPVFVEAAAGADPYLAAEQAFAAALKKGAVVWLAGPGRAPRRSRWRRHAATGPREQPVWYVYEGGLVYVLTGPGEQQVPGLTEAAEVELLVRSKDVRSRIARVPAAVRVVPGTDPLFDRVARAGLGRRLNLPDGDEALERWRATCALVELTPRFRPATAAPQVANGAAPAAAAAAAGDGAAAAAGAPAAGAATSAKAEDIHVEAQVDEEVFQRLIAEGKSERVARAQAKAAYVRREKARIRAEREQVPG